jgi:hypothetical protein
MKYLTSFDMSVFTVAVNMTHGPLLLFEVLTFPCNLTFKIKILRAGSSFDKTYRNTEYDRVRFFLHYIAL